MVYGTYLQAASSIFNYLVLQAPGEAEAELAELNQKEEIDVILSEDSDRMVYEGIRCPLCHPNVGMLFYILT